MTTQTAPYTTIGGLSVDTGLQRFVEDELLPSIGREPAAFWSGLERLVDEIMPRNRDLLEVREDLQRRIDAWHLEHPGTVDEREYESFLREIGYLQPEPPAFTITTEDVDAEIATIAGPQLVVPVLNARFVLNAVNARWGSLYDALYGSDVIPASDDEDPGAGYDPVRGAKVIAWVRAFLDEIAPLTEGSHADVVRYSVDGPSLIAELPDERTAGPAGPAEVVGHRGDAAAPDAILLRHHGLHLEIDIDADSEVGRQDTAGVQDVFLEAALTTIVDFEDSTAAVDAEDKTEAYRTWWLLNRGELTADVDKGGSSFVRRAAGDREYTAADGSPLTLPGRSVLYVRNVGHLMTTDAVLDAQGREIGEGVLDALLTTAGALPGGEAGNPMRFTRTGSIYIVKPKMHSPDEVQLAVDLFAGVEDVLGLPRNTVKLGLMDEERRMSANLAAGIHAARERLVFINTGFLDRSGDEIHTDMQAGPIVRKGDMKSQKWILSYEDLNVDTGLASGLRGHAQIGKGMWAMPDLMADMVEQKIGQPKAGASTAWVPSPTAATLHALHYHRVDPIERQAELEGGHRAAVSDLLELPLVDPSTVSDDDRQQELDNNIQSLLGYVVRWVGQGIGCSKVPDIHDVALMEDRATLRISSQLVANWLHHGLVDETQVRETLRRMAAVVDEQNAGDAAYEPMAADFAASIPFAAAEELIFAGLEQPSGYTEPILHRRRREQKDLTRGTQQ